MKKAASFGFYTGVFSLILGQSLCFAKSPLKSSLEMIRAAHNVPSDLSDFTLRDRQDIFESYESSLSGLDLSPADPNACLQYVLAPEPEQSIESCLPATSSTKISIMREGSGTGGV